MGKKASKRLLSNKTQTGTKAKDKQRTAEAGSGGKARLLSIRTGAAV